MKKPNFFLIGAPKCGTTSLAYWLAQHPQIYFSPIKEPKFFCTDGFIKTKTMEEYEACFVGAESSHKAIGEGSATYLYSEVAISNIMEYAPNARFIVCLRNPVEMAPSWHAQQLKDGLEDVKSFACAWGLQNAREDGQKIPHYYGQQIPADMKSHVKVLQYGKTCKLGEQLARLYNIVPAEKVLCILLDDLRVSPEREYQRVLRFLGIEQKCGGIIFEKKNEYRKIRILGLDRVIKMLLYLKRKSGITHSFGVLRTVNKLNTGAQKREPLSVELRQELIHYFRNDVQLLSRLLDRDLSVWLLVGN
jgi:hypothetical protein